MKRIAVVVFICLCFSLFADSSSKMLEEWNRLSEDEQWLCLLTEPFLSPKKMSLTTVNPEPKNNGKNSKNYLESSWKLYSREDVLNLVEKYENGKWGFSNEYIIAKNFYEKYPDSSIDEIATIECLDIYQIMYLWFYAENKEKMGEHHFLALDAMRILSVIRWCVAVGWFSETEAVETAKPIMEQILDAYDSWEDYTSHFALGWSFYDLLWICDLKKYQKDFSAEIKKYNGSRKQNISHDIKFPAKNRKNSRILTYADAIYNPCEEASKWYLMRKYNYFGIKSLSYTEKETYKAVRKEKSNVPIIALWDLVASENYDHLDEYIKIFEKVKSKTNVYHRFYTWCGFSLIDDNRPDQLLSIMTNFEKEKSYYYLNAFYKIYQLSTIVNENVSMDNIEYILTNTENYAKEAIESFETAKKVFPVNGNLKEIVSGLDMIMKFYLFEIYTECTYMYYETRDLEKAVSYIGEADKYLELLKECNSEFASIDDVKTAEDKLNEVKSFITTRYGSITNSNIRNDESNFSILSEPFTNSLDNKTLKQLSEDSNKYQLLTEPLKGLSNNSFNEQNIISKNNTAKIEEWNSLSEDEKWFCLLSEPLMERASLSITTVNPEKNIYDYAKNKSLTLLQENWGLFSKEDVIAILKTYQLKEDELDVIFNEVKTKLKQTSKTAIEKLAIKECLDSSSIARLYFASEIQNILGEHGLLAWNNGQMLAILRWSIAAGWLTEKEALNLAKPLINEIINAYTSWEDYAVHYAFGSTFFAFIEEEDCENYFNTTMDCIKKYDITISEKEKTNVFTYHNTKFPGKNRKNNRILTYKDAVYKPQKEAEIWKQISIAEDNDYEISIESSDIDFFLKRNKKIPAAAYFMATIQTIKESNELIKIVDTYKGKDITEDDKNEVLNLYLKSLNKMKTYYNEANLSFIKTETQNELYFKFYITYAFICYYAGDMQTMDFAMSKLDENKCGHISDYHNINCIYYTYKANKSASHRDYKSAIELAKKALHHLEKGSNLPGWNLITKENLQGYQETLNKLIENYEYYLKLNEIHDGALPNTKG
ncbi:MAG: DUF1266 domain-containing protein [Treponemataceae bacterium]|nr:DUF1266 domain-containing protein [Treponemataceae bacterium]